MTDSQSLFRTRFYSDCVGVFQGGGCRAAAFGGAYAAAYEFGVRFIEVAGTSAGSIVAALIAAGASADFMLKQLQSLDFRHLLTKPKRSTFSHSPSLLRFAQCAGVLAPAIRAIVLAAKYGGLYSSERIEEWIEARLRELTGKNGVVEFQDLLLPLHVVAGDLGAMRARIWSSAETPRQSVAHAVRASCSLPLFFQPVEEGSGLLVDGGIVSNLPHFLFANACRSGHSATRLLLFSLEAHNDRARANDLKELLSQLAALVVDGGTNVQLSFTPDVARIVIPTGDIRATDFDRMDAARVSELVEKGRAAAKAFLTRELVNTRSTLPQRPIMDEHEAYLAITEQLYSVCSHVFIALPTSLWFWEIFPTVLHWRKKGVRVRALLSPVSPDTAEAAKENQRRSFMAGLGIEIHETPSLPVQGVFLDLLVNDAASGLVYVSDRSDYDPFARFYSQRVDRAALYALHKLLQLLPQPAANKDQDSPTIQLQRMQADVLLERLRQNVQFYRDPQVSLNIEQVDVSRVLLVSRFVRAFRYMQIGSLIDHYRERELSLFEPACVTLRTKDISIVTPPVVEVAGDHVVAVEGNTRFLYCYNNGIDRVSAVVVRGTRAELPGRPVQLRDVRITSRKREPQERIAAYDYRLFRHIERAVRPIEDTQP